DQSHMMILLVYVDDIILTGSSQAHLHSFINQLGAEFDIRDLGRLNYFLGIAVTYHSDSIHLTYTKYALNILKRHNMLDCKPVSTPMASKGRFSRTHGTPLTYSTFYRQLVGALQYLTMTRPDISYVVQHVSQFIGSPTDAHLEAAKRILHYLKGTPGHCIPIRCSTNSSFLVAFSYAD
ncbi:uncharacterized protein LOC110745446, partial [Prunus avium]|uniref:Uncharacterized protein LOC110745446 n=1 Tax=Prunus avium TaxID=42229 RepID=A0A6P5RE69_PRUAV